MLSRARPSRQTQSDRTLTSHMQIRSSLQQRRWERRTTFFIVFTTSDPSLPVSAGLTARVPCLPFDKPVRGGAGTGTGGQALSLEADVTAANHV